MRNIILLLLISISFSCKKEFSCEDCQPKCSYLLLSKQSVLYSNPVRFTFIGILRGNSAVAYLYTMGGEYDSIVEGGTITLGDCKYDVYYKESVWYNTSNNGSIQVDFLELEINGKSVMYYPGFPAEYNNSIIGQYIKISQ